MPETDTSTFDGFMQAFTGERPVHTIDVPSQNSAMSPFIVLRYGNRTVVVNPIGLSDHLSVDVHTFVDGQRAAAGAFGMTNGRRNSMGLLGGGVPTPTSHGWNGGHLIAVLVGEQGTTTEDPENT